MYTQAYKVVYESPNGKTYTSAKDLDDDDYWLEGEKLSEILCEYFDDCPSFIMKYTFKNRIPLEVKMILNPKFNIANYY